jgi:S1 RNA binding domain protein
MEEAKQPMELTVGAIFEGKVKTITNFGAFIALPENKTGMVHISEVANTYVSDIRQHLTEGQDVKVVVIGTENGKINLSMKRLEPKPQREMSPRGGNFRSGAAPRREGAPAQGQPRPARTPTPPPAPKSADQLFEERLKAFMSESDSKLSSMRADHRTKSRRR